MSTLEVQLNSELIEDFCRRWKIEEFALFGSVLSNDFRYDSDVDVMVSFRNDATWSLLDHVVMQDELVAIFGRNVDLVTRKGVERSRNAIRRKSILSNAKVIYAAA